MNPRTGRPPSENARTQSLLIRMSEDEQATLRAAAEADGKPLGTWLRDLGLARAKRQR